MHHGFQNTHLRIAKMHMMINKNMIMFGASSLSMGGSISTPRPSTQPKQYHELKQYKKIKLWYRTKHLKSLQTIIKQLLTFDFWEWSLNGKRGIVSLVNRPGLLSVPSLLSIKSHLRSMVYPLNSKLYCGLNRLLVVKNLLSVQKSTLRSPSLLLLVDPICKNTYVRSRCFSCHIM